MLNLGRIILAGVWTVRTPMAGDWSLSVMLGPPELMLGIMSRIRRSRPRSSRSRRRVFVAVACSPKLRAVPPAASASAISHHTANWVALRMMMLWASEGSPPMSLVS